MQNNVFKSNQNSKGMTFIQSDLCTDGIKTSNTDNPNLVAIVWRSPHASLKCNQQLEKDLYRIYMKYYFYVMLESFGQFW